MAYRLKPGEAVDDALRRIAHEQIDKALAELADPELDADHTVHQVRKRCKKLRALLRLVRPALGDTYRRENVWLRDTARGLSRLRDAATVIETLDALEGHYAQVLDDRAFAPLRERLVQRRDRLAAAELGRDAGADEGMRACAERLRDVRDRVDGWRLDAGGWDAVGGGLAKTYRRARRARKRAASEPATSVFHRWRKRVKYHALHLRLVAPAWDGPIGARQSDAKRLADLLGDDHDLSELRAAVLEDDADPQRVQPLLGLIGQRQVELRTRALNLGERLFAERADALRSRYGAVWRAWRREHEGSARRRHAPRLASD